ncbi:MAG: FHA domain-containing protein, partial [Microthrixaceae bacterium]
MDVALVVEGPDGGAARPVIVDVEAEASAGALLDAAWRHLGGLGSCEHEAVLARTGQAVDPDAQVGALELRHGDRLVIGGGERSPTGAPRVVRTPPTGGRTKRSSTEKHPFELLLVGGPASGARFPLTVGEHVVGRSSEATITLADDTVSREHLLVAVSADAVEVSDLGSTNGSFLDGKPLEGRASLAPGQVVEVGSSMVTVEPVAAERRVGQHPYRDGRLLFNRPPRVTRPFAPPKFKLPVPPDRPAKRKFPLGASVIPVVLGVPMALFISPIFLIFLAMGPAMAIWSVVDDRRSGRKEFRAASAKFRSYLASLSERLDSARGTALLARRDASPSPAHLVDRARSLSPDLWERRPDQSDFLQLRLGIGDLPSVVEIEGGEGGDEEMRAQADRLQSEHAVDRDVPVTVDLREDGVLGLAGSLAPCESLARWLVVQAVTLHSPRDLALVVLTTHERLTEWEWTRWLPHTEALVPGLRSVAVD